MADATHSHFGQDSISTRYSTPKSHIILHKRANNIWVTFAENDL